MLLFKISLRNIMLHKLKTIVIGFIIVFGAFLAIIGNTFVDGISSGMKQSLVNSITGDIQIYAKDAEEELSVFGNVHGSPSDIGHVNNFKKIKQILLKEIKNIKKVIPLGTNSLMFNPGNLLDIKLENLRAMFKESPRDWGRIRNLKNHIRAIIENIKHDFVFNVEKTQLMTKDSDFKDSGKHLAKALSRSFRMDFDRNYESRIEYLANKIAPLMFDDTMIFMHYVGTIPGEFRDAFGQFEMVKGEFIPEGKRGFLFNDFIYENMVKHRIARRLDTVKKELTKNHKKIATDKKLKDDITANIAQAAEIYTQLDPLATGILMAKLKLFLNSKKGNIRELIMEFLDMNDVNFLTRYDYFYKNIAPGIILYRVQIGDTFPVTSVSKNGTVSSLNMKVYGTFRYKSFESSPIAGNFSLMDLISFRDLYGFMTEEKRQETRELEKEMGLMEAKGSNIEDLFSKKDHQLEKVASQKNPAMVPRSGLFTKDIDFAQRRDIFKKTYSREEFENGPFFNAALILQDPGKLARTLREINDLSNREKLGIKAVSWQSAAGMVGQLTFVIRLILGVCITIVFLVATFIIMNSMLMATMERTREIGTMRAIGAQKKFLLKLFISEAFLLSVIFGIIGSLLAIPLILFIGKVGIPATGDIATFFFSGTRLYLSLNFLHVFITLIGITLISVISVLYPVWKAMQISPVTAMQKNE